MVWITVTFGWPFLLGVMMKRLFAILILLAGAALAQTTTTISGTILGLDGSPATSGQVTFTLTPGVDTTISGVGRFTPGQPVVCGIDGTGSVKNVSLSGSCVVTRNSSLLPAGTAYKVAICPSYACSSSFYVYALNNTLDLSTVVPTPTTSPVADFIDILSSQTVTGAKTFNNAANSFSGTFAGTIAASSVTSSSTISSVGNGTIGGMITAGSAAHTITTAAGLLDLAQTSGVLSVTHGGTGVSAGPIPASLGGTGVTSFPLPVPLSNGGLGQTSLADGPNIKHKRVTGCTTAASANASCSTTVTWTTPFADTNYTTVCQPQGTTNAAGVYVTNITTILAASVVVTWENAGAQTAAQSGFLNCIAIHD